MTLVGLQGKVHREIKAQVHYAFDAERGYDNVLTIVPSKGEVIDPPGSVSQGRLLKEVAIRSTAGKFCAPGEVRQCFWSGRWSHPDDLRTCVLTGLPIHCEFATAEGAPRLQPLAEMLDGIRRTADETLLWDNVGARVTSALEGRKCKVEAAVLSPAKAHLAACAEARSFLGILA
jgi:hypothetical protein